MNIILARRGIQKRHSGLLAEEKGSMYIIVMMIIMVLSIFISGHLSGISNEYKMTKRYTRSISALNLAEAGIEEALWELSYGNKGFPTDKGWTGPLDLKTMSGALLNGKGAMIGDYTVNVVNISTSNPIIVATGYAPSSQAADFEERTVRTEFVQTSGGLDYGIFGEDSVTISGGATIDSYNSSDGAYGDQVPQDNGNIATNGDITINGDGSYINGDATPGPGQTVSDPDQVSGDSTPNAETVVLNPIPPAEIADAEANNNNAIIPVEFWQGDPADYRLKLTAGDALTLTEGIYYFTEWSQSGGTLTTTGQVTIYITGDVNMTGGSLINDTQIPANLVIKSTAAPTPDNMMLAGGSDIYAVVYAPNCDIKISSQGADFYGSAISGGDLVITGGGEFHYDEALNELNKSSSSYRMLSWSEVF